MSNFTVIGTLKEKKEKQEGISKAGKDWVKQDFLIDTGDQYNPIMQLGVFGQGKVNDLENLNVNESITVHFNIICREYNGKYYTNLDAWKVERTPQADAPTPKEDKNDLPF